MRYHDLSGRIMQKQCRQNVLFTNHAFDSLIPALKFRKYDTVISGMDITPGRGKQVALAIPIMRIPRW